MKFRADFVTNSSSSCFIFKDEVDMDENIAKSFFLFYLENSLSDMQDYDFIREELIKKADFNFSEIYKELNMTSFFWHRYSSRYINLLSKTIVKTLRNFYNQNELSEEQMCIICMEVLNRCEDIFSEKDFPTYKLKPTHEHKAENVLTVFSCAEDFVYKSIFDDYTFPRYLIDLGEYDAAREAFWMSKAKENLSDNIMMKLAGVLALEFIDEKYYNWLPEREQKFFKGEEYCDMDYSQISAEEIENYMKRYEKESSRDKFFREFVMQHFEKMSNLIKNYADMQPGVILEQITGAKYLAYSNLKLRGSAYLIEEYFEQSVKECIYTCGYLSL